MRIDHRPPPVREQGGHRRGSPGFRRVSLALFSAGLATFTVLYCVQALLPPLAGEFRLSPAAASLAVSVGTAALAVGIIPLTALSEALGRTPVLTGALFAAAGLGLSQAASPTFAVLLVLRGLQGLAVAGVVAVAMSYLAEELHPESLGFAMGLYVAGNSIGGMAGRLIAGLVVDLAGWRWALAAVGAVALLCAVVFRLAILPSARFVPRPLRLRALAGSVGRGLGDAGLLRLYATGFLLMACFVTVYNYLGFRLLGAEFRLTQSAVGLIFLGYLAGTVSSAAAGRLVERLGRRRLLVISMLITLAGLGLMLGGGLPVVVGGLVITTGGFFGAHTVASGWVSARARALGVQGAALYLFGYYLGSSVGGTLGGLAYAAAGWGGVTAFGALLLLGVLALAGTRAAGTPAAGGGGSPTPVRAPDQPPGRTWR